MVLNPRSRNKRIKSPKVSGYYGIIIFLLLLFIDRLTKIFAVSLKAPMDFGVFEFIYTVNTGAGFSILNGQNALLIWVAVIALGAIIFFHDQFPKSGFILIIAGLIGNLIDRVSYGYVIDFINFKFWPVFNASDSFIFIGAVITIIVWWRKDKEENKAKVKSGTAKKTRKKVRK